MQNLKFEVMQKLEHCYQEMLLQFLNRTVFKKIIRDIENMDENVSVTCLKRTGNWRNAW